MRTVGDLVEAVRSELLGAGREQRNALSASSITASATSITFAYDLGGITRGAEIVIGDERIYVLDADKVSKTATVVRGTLGTTASTHAASAEVEVNPRFPTPSIRDALVDEIASWRMKVPTVWSDVLNTSGSRAVNIPAYDREIVYLASVEAVPSAGDPWRTVKGRLIRSVPFSVNASGLVLQLQDYVPQSLRVVYASPYNLEGFGEDSSYLADYGIGESLFDVAKYGACWRLMQSREAARSDINAQGDSRNAEEVGVGQASQISARYERIRDKRLAEEQSAFATLYPRRWL